MNNIFQKKWLFILAALLLSACSDGEMASPGAGTEIDKSVAAAPPAILSFTASKDEISPGETVTLMWEIQESAISDDSDGEVDPTEKTPLAKEMVKAVKSLEGAEESDEEQVFSAALQIVIESQNQNFVFSHESSEAFGSVDVFDLQEDTTFCLTASFVVPVVDEEETSAKAQKTETEKTNEEEPPAPPAMAEACLTVSVKVDSTVSVIDFYLEEEAMILHWKCSPEEAIAFISSEPEDSISLTDCGAASSEEAIAQALPADGFPSAGCAVISPTAPTTYKLLCAVEGKDEIATATLVVGDTDNTDEEVALSFQASSSKIFEPTDIQLVWSVSNTNAAVTITKTNSSGESSEVCTGSAEGSCVDEQVSETTKYTLTASVDGKSIASESLQVVFEQAIDEARLSVNFSGPSAALFSGEQVELSWSVSEGEVSSATITPPSGRPIDASSGKAMVTASAGSYSLELVVSGTKIQKSISLNMVILQSQGEDLSVCAAAAGKTGYGGLDLGPYSAENSKIKIVKTSGSSAEEIEIDAIAAFNEGTNTKAGNDYVTNIISTFPVNAIATHPQNSQRVFVGTTGIVLYKNNDGAWKNLTRAYLVKGNDDQPYPGSHASCFGQTQTGTDQSVIVTFNRICDIELASSGKIFIGTDFGPLSTKADVESYISERKNDKWNSRDNVLYGVVVNDIALVEAGSLTAFAGTSQGAFVSLDGGASWNDFNNESSLGDVFSMDGSSAGGQVFAAGSSGLFRTSLSGGTWEKLGSISGEVNAVSIDKADPNIVYAGGPSGFYVSRNSGGSFVQVSSVSVKSIDNSSSEEGFALFVATENGFMRASSSGASATAHMRILELSLIE